MRLGLRGLLRVLTLSCRDAARLTSDACERDLPTAEVAALRLHLVVCGSCRRYRQQIGRLGEAIDRLAGAGVADEGDASATAAVVSGLPPEVRQRIVGALVGAAGAEGPRAPEGGG